MIFFYFVAAEHLRAAHSYELETELMGENGTYALVGRAPGIRWHAFSREGCKDYVYRSFGPVSHNHNTKA